MTSSRSLQANAAGDPDAAARFLTRTANWLIGVYLVVVIGLMVTLKVSLGMDVATALVALGVVAIGRRQPFVRDWGPFLLILIAWEGMRGVASAFGQTVQSDSVIAIERFIFGGRVPTVELQRALYGGAVQLHDVLLTLLYVSHFAFPVAFALVLWLRDRPVYYRFVITLMGVSFASFLTFLVLPVAPPRFAFQYGEALPVVDVVGAVSRSVDWGAPSWVYTNLVGNPVAAFPSMHAAYPFVVFLFLGERSWRLAAAWLPITCAIWFATVYLGHHYVVDVLGGVAYGTVGYIVVKRLMGR